jgi:hypothetical protein
MFVYSLELYLHVVWRDSQRDERYSTDKETEQNVIAYENKLFTIFSLFSYSHSNVHSLSPLNVKIIFLSFFDSLICENEVLNGTRGVRHTHTHTVIAVSSASLVIRGFSLSIFLMSSRPSSLRSRLSIISNSFQCVSLCILVFTKCVQKVHFFHFFVRIIMLRFKSEK